MIYSICSPCISLIRLPSDKNRKKISPMETFRMIEVMRNRNRFSEGDYGRYKNYLKVQMRGLGSGEGRDLYKLESNLSKFLIFNSTGFLKSNLRILRRDGSEFGAMYSCLTKGILENAMKKPIDTNALVGLRGRLAGCKTFVNQIDALLESPSSNFDVSSLRVRHMWNDISVGFNSEAERNEFLEGKAPLDDGYDADIAKGILKVERRRAQLLSLIESKPTRVICIDKKAERLLEALRRLKAILGENLVESGYVEQAVKDAEELKSYYSRIAMFMKCLEWDGSIDTFSVPLSFKVLESRILKVREDFSYVPRKYPRSVVIRYLEDSLRPRRPTIKTPFIPVLFDIARDYISYPAEDGRISEVLKKLDMSK
uniref:Uncharacterized protein n=1 Tax=Encephalitozoon cuniculi TaxID=6035 RepID=M1K829_ENCCN|nr:hypothetical protein ECU05_1260 [Encephalitozoon cuniculi]